MGEIVVDNGLERFVIKNQKGEELGEFWMNPTDVEIIKRYDTVADNLAKVADCVTDDMPTEEIIKVLEEKVSTEINYLFNADVASSFFSITSPFSVLSTGEFFVENVLNAISAIISDRTGERMKRVRTRANKYTAKYHG